MTPEEREIARAFVACEQWKWLPGMLVRYEDGKVWYRLIDGDGYGNPFKHVPPNPRRAWPDITDPCTRGGIVRVIEDAWGGPVGVWYPRAGGCGIALGHLPVVSGRVFIAPTKAEALLRALQAAPEVTDD